MRCEWDIGKDMTYTLSVYLPQDRRVALLNNSRLPGRTSGAALFADISGFTSLSKKLTRQLGDRRGIEELTGRINSVYDTLIRLAELYRGSVVSFAGDGITCWFDVSEGKPSLRATRVALDEDPVYQEVTGGARTALGEAAFNAAFEAGQKLTLEKN